MRHQRLAILGIILSVSHVHQARADTVADAITHLQQGRPVLLTMEVTQGTLDAGQAYWLSYRANSVPAGGFDCQGFSRSWATYHMARYFNASLNAGQVSCWGMQATLAEVATRLYLTVGGVPVARLAPLSMMKLPLEAGEKIDHDLHDPYGYFSFGRNPAALAQRLNSDFADRRFSRHREVAAWLEELARYKPFTFRKETWDDTETVVATLVSYLRANALSVAQPYGVDSDYSSSFCSPQCPSPYEDYQTSAMIIRALYAYGQAYGSFTDFNTISKRFMDDALAKRTWSAESPNGRMQIMWVIARRFHVGLDDRVRLTAAANLLLTPVLWEQMTDQSEWVCGPKRGWGGWIHDLQANATPDKCSQPAPNDFYKQNMGYHLFIVQGLAESYRLLDRHNLLNDYAFFRDNAPWNLLASVAWVYQLGGHTDCNGRSGVIFDRWTDLNIDGTPDSCGMYGTPPGVQSVYEVMRSFDVSRYGPYSADYGAATFSYSDLDTRTRAAVSYAGRIILLAGSQIYSDALYAAFGSDLQYGAALHDWIF